MKNAMLGYILKYDLKRRLTGCVILGTLAAVLATVIAIIVNGDSDAHGLNNFSTSAMLFWSFGTTCMTASVALQSSVCFNRSRSSVIKSLMLTIAVSVVLVSCLSFAFEALIMKITDNWDLGYKFLPLVKAFEITSDVSGFTGMLAAFAFQMLFCFLICICAVLFICIFYRAGKWAWIGFWVFYMLIMFTGKEVFSGVGSGAVKLFGSAGNAVLAAVAILTVAFTAVSVVLLKKHELRKNLISLVKKA